MAETQETERDPLETGAPAWQAKAQAAVREWAVSAPFMEGGVNLAEVMEYAVIDAVNRRYMEADRASVADNGTP
jgi:hypothetical protein